MVKAVVFFSIVPALVAQKELGVIKKMHLQKERFKRIDVTTDYLLQRVGMKTMSCTCPRAQRFRPCTLG